MVNVYENMDMSITYIKNGTNVENSSESGDGISFENKMSVTAQLLIQRLRKYKIMLNFSRENLHSSYLMRIIT